MKKIKTIVFTTERAHEWLKKHEEDIRKSLNEVQGAEFAPFVYRYADIMPPKTYSGSDGKVRISQDWFENTFTVQAKKLGFDTCIFHFTRDKREEWGLYPRINGSYLRDKDNDKVWDFWVCADEHERSSNPQKDRRIRQYERVFLHEYAHGIVHFWHPERREDVHEWDYKKNDIKSIFSTFKAPVSLPEPVLVVDTRYAMNNYWPNNDPRSLVLHTTGGYGIEGAVQTLIARGLSYNYIIHKGRVYELVHYSNSAWHAGIKKSPNLRVQSFYGPENPNKESVGVAFTYPETGDITVLPEEDVDAFVLLSKKIGKETGVRYNADNIFYHQEITIDKPKMVEGYRKQVLDALVGDKDTKDAGEKSYTQLMIQFLKLKIQYLLLMKKLKK